MTVSGAGTSPQNLCVSTGTASGFGGSAFDTCALVRVDDQQIAFEPVVGVPFEAAAFRVHLQQPVDGLGLEPGGFGHALGGTATRLVPASAGKGICYSKIDKVKRQPRTLVRVPGE
jgi:hypothetical protein